MRLEKVWLSAFAHESRETHMAANAQAKDLEEAFTVGGEQLMFPGDVSLGGSAGNTINCLCTTFERVK